MPVVDVGRAPDAVHGAAVAAVRGATNLVIAGGVAALVHVSGATDTVGGAAIAAVGCAADAVIRGGIPLAIVSVRGTADLVHGVASISCWCDRCESSSGDDDSCQFRNFHAYAFCAGSRPDVVYFLGDNCQHTENDDQHQADFEHCSGRGTLVALTD